MSRARQIFLGEFYLLTRNCTQRMFLLHPDPETNNAFAYCLIEAAIRFEIEILLPIAEPNHHHTVIFDRYGRCPQFLEHFHKMFARCQNARLGRWENLWAAEEACVTRLLDRETVIAKLVYAASNPVKDMLVERADQWPGINGYRELLSDKPLKATRPRHFFREDGVMPAEVSLRLTIPSELGPAAAVIAEVKSGVEAVERSMQQHRARTGARVLGVAKILARSWRDSPTSHKPRRSLRPRFAGHHSTRLAALLDFRSFLAAYRAARKHWLAGEPATFPAGTYWLARFAAVSVAPTPIA
jgi:hypothetical protein